MFLVLRLAKQKTVSQGRTVTGDAQFSKSPSQPGNLEQEIGMNQW